MGSASLFSNNASLKVENNLFNLYSEPIATASIISFSKAYLCSIAFVSKMISSSSCPIVAKAGELTDEGNIRKVDEMNMDYVLVEKGAVLNWFDIDAPEGRFSLNDKISDIMETKRGKMWFVGMGLTLKKKMNQGKKKDSGEKKSGGFDVDLKGGQSSGLMQMLGGFSVLRLTSMMGMMNISFTKEELLKMNKKLNKIKKPTKKK